MFLYLPTTYLLCTDVCVDLSHLRCLALSLSFDVSPDLSLSLFVCLEKFTFDTSESDGARMERGSLNPSHRLTVTTMTTMAIIGCSAGARDGRDRRRDGRAHPGQGAPWLLRLLQLAPRVRAQWRRWPGRVCTIATALALTYREASPSSTPHRRVISRRFISAFVEDVHWRCHGKAQNTTQTQQLPAALNCVAAAGGPTRRAGSRLHS